jgi:hypothetical protein
MLAEIEKTLKAQNKATGQGASPSQFIMSTEDTAQALRNVLNTVHGDDDDDVNSNGSSNGNSDSSGSSSSNSSNSGSFGRWGDVHIEGPLVSHSGLVKMGD